ncbi:MAG: restriction endonuclease [Nitrospinae bacterium RIFCSPLOWO2_01_FULL_39_10]|nr:MAG: restriction endonuclease [Nitrospinae bacterium RIFCSPLOWO2_01_FULL_39_10]
MKYSSIFKDKIGCKNEKEVFSYLITNLNDSIRSWDYFVNWKKVIGNIRDIEVDLNILNYLIGKEKIEQEFEYLLQRHPKILRLIPILIACREHNYKILTDLSIKDLKYEDFSFEDKKSLTDKEISKAVRFVSKSGLLKLFKDKTIKNVVDYTIGIEVGLDSNGRKNRGGTAMEKIIETYIKGICNSHGFSYVIQATSEKVFDKWGLKLSIDKSSRRFDFALYNGKKLYLIESNYYGGGGSKLKSTAGEYKALYDFISKDGHKFIWVTDGIGWQSTSRPLEETFNYIEYLLNLKMLTQGLFEDIIVNNL